MKLCLIQEGKSCLFDVVTKKQEANGKWLVSNFNDNESTLIV
jgi:hypothetical protein